MATQTWTNWSSIHFNWPGNAQFTPVECGQCKTPVTINELMIGPDQGKCQNCQTTQWPK